MEKNRTENRWVFPIASILLLVLTGIGAFLVTRINDVRLYFFFILGLISVAVTLWKIDWGLFMLVLISYARISDVAVHFYGAPSLLQPFIAFLAVLILIKWLVNGEAPRGWIRPALIISAYGAVIFLSLLYADEAGSAQQGLISFLKDGVIAIMLVILIQSRRSFRMAAWGLIAVGLLLGTIAVIQYLTGSFSNPYWGLAESQVMNIVGRVEGYRIMGTFDDPNFFAQIMLVIVPVALNRFIYEEKIWLRILAVWSLAASFLTVVFTFSRGGFLALCLVIVLIVLWRRPSPAIILIGLLLLVVFVPFLPSEYLERMGTILEYLPSMGTDVRTEVSFRGRLSEYAVGWQMFLDHPVFGIGYENYPRFYLDYSVRLGLDPRRTERSAHSLYLEILAEQGLIGMLLFGFVIYSVYRSLISALRKLEKMAMQAEADLVFALLIGFSGYLVAAIFIHAAFPRNLWILVGMGFAVSQMAENEHEKMRTEFYKKRLQLGKGKAMREKRAV